MTEIKSEDGSACVDFIVAEDQFEIAELKIDLDQLVYSFPIQFVDLEPAVWKIDPDCFNPPIPRYCLASDGSHGYFIPHDKEAEWEAWLETDEADPPDWATRIDGGQLTFFFPEII